MGERAGYRVRQRNQVSPILRKQWYIGGTKEDLKKLVLETAKYLMGKGTPWQREKTPKISDGFVALRNDLDLGRTTLAMYSVLYSPPFDSMEFSENCDISDHGLFEIELFRWNVWHVNHYKVDWDTGKLSQKLRLFTVEFAEGKTLENGVKFLSFSKFIAKELLED